MKGDGEPRLAERLNRSRLAEHACPRGNQHVLPAVGVHRVRDQAVDGGGSASVEPVGQYGIDDRSLQQRVQRARGADRVRSLGCASRRSPRRWSGAHRAPGPLGRVARPGNDAPRRAAVARTTASAISSRDGGSSHVIARRCSGRRQAGDRRPDALPRAVG